MSDSIANNNNGAPETSAPANNHEPAHDRRADVNRTEVNRANAAHSTGPRTAAGKQRSSLNALMDSPATSSSFPRKTTPPTNTTPAAFFDDLQPRGALANLSMHEHRLSRQFERTLHQLREIQADRREKEKDQMEKASLRCNRRFQEAHAAAAGHSCATIRLHDLLAGHRRRNRGNTGAAGG